jgi:hypothetical protein
MKLEVAHPSLNLASTFPNDRVHFRQVVRLTAQGRSRVLDGETGMTFTVDSWGGVDDRCANVRDYRYIDVALGRKWQIWTLGPDDFERIAE